jgi:hypothetical protein
MIPPLDARRAQVLAWHDTERLSFAAIAPRLGVSRERVRQLYASGRKRLAALTRPAEPAASPFTCANCGQPRPHMARGRCNTCYVYFRRNGRDRPPEGCARRANAGPSKNCGRPASSSYRGYCRACHMYWWKHGTDRPPQGFAYREHAGPCKNCGQPAPSDRRGYCRPYHRYQGRYGVERPARLWPRTARTAT